MRKPQYRTTFHTFKHRQGDGAEFLASCCTLTINDRHLSNDSPRQDVLHGVQKTCNTTDELDQWCPCSQHAYIEPATTILQHFHTNFLAIFLLENSEHTVIQITVQRYISPVYASKHT